MTTYFNPELKSSTCRPFSWSTFTPASDSVECHSSSVWCDYFNFHKLSDYHISAMHLNLQVYLVPVLVCRYQDYLTEKSSSKLLDSLKPVSYLSSYYTQLYVNNCMFLFPKDLLGR